MVERIHPLYYAFDLLSDVLSGTESSRFMNVLVKELGLFTHVHAYITGDIDKGLFIVEGKLSPEVTFEAAEKAIFDILNSIAINGIPETELNKVKNKKV